MTELETSSSFNYLIIIHVVVHGWMTLMNVSGQDIKSYFVLKYRGEYTYFTSAANPMDILIL